MATSGKPAAGVGAACDVFAVSHLRPALAWHPVGDEERIRVALAESIAPQVTVSCRGPNGALREVPLRNGEVCVIPPGRGCDLQLEARTELTLLSLDRRFCERESLRHSGTRFRLPDLYAGDDPYLRRVATVLVTGLRMGRPLQPDYLEATARDLARHISARYGRTNKGARSKGIPEARLARVLARIERDLKQPLPIAELAAEAFLSEFHFSRMFRYSTGYSPHTYLTMRRMDRAKKLLAEGTMPLAQVAAEVGYKTQAHFTSVFHGHCGMTPAAYRRARAPRPSSRNAGA